MSVNITDGIESGKVVLKVLTTNTTSVTLLTDDKFKGKVIQPGPTANRAVGEHGFSMSMEIKDGDLTRLFLLDTGSITQMIIENANQFGIDLSTVEKLILSHGHFDHWGGLTKVMPLLKEGTEIILNPRVFDQNYAAVSTTGEEIPAEELGPNLKTLEREGKLKISRKLPPFNKNLISNLAEEQGVKIIEANEPIKLFDGIATSGEIELFDVDEVTKGLYIQKSRKEFEKHLFRDETAIYINVKDKGLAVITGCGHCGIMNTIKHGQKLTGIDKVYAAIGGFHEEWNPPEMVEQKVKYIESLNPEITCGMHCTGFEFNRIMARHPSHTLGVVGTEFHL
ncbi:MAG: MBL fold metallo-hydrolase [Promethearchaeota archaeon]|nr:MAG: MBL fold metallo-hydrolase [Candidatus Lokiarchaeota archaeon]